MPAIKADLLAAFAGALSIAVALVLAHAALIKVQGHERMLKVMREFARVPPAWANAARMGAAIAELAACVAILWPSTRQAGGAAAAVLWAVYTGLLLRAVLSGRGHVDCGCAAASRQRQLDLGDVVRAGALTLSAVFVAISQPSRGAVHYLLDLAAGGILFVLYGAWNQLYHRAPLAQSWR